MKIRLKPYLQPFERHLALREYSALTGRNAVLELGDEEWVEVPTAFEAKFNTHATYWDRWSHPPAGWTTQVSREASVMAIRNSLSLSELKTSLPTRSSAHFPNRRVLRYGPHGIHEYRGKFFPQLVQSLANIADLTPGQILYDPMCGSGTTLTEGAIRGAHVIGADLNPLSILISTAKVHALFVSPDHLQSTYETLRKRLLSAKTQCSFRKDGWFIQLRSDDRKYLLNWFPKTTLLALDRIMKEIRSIGDARLRELFLVSLSNILRSVSYQRVDDLRVRRDEKVDEDHDPYREFLDELATSIRAILALRWQQGPPPPVSAKVIRGDARLPLAALSGSSEKPHLCITSPPYATALPYLDTDRLSLIYLGLTTRAEQRELESRMIGNRELDSTLRSQIAAAQMKARRQLPSSVFELVDNIEIRNGSNVGFRRKNLPFLLAKYFIDMRSALHSLRNSLHSHGSAFLVIGRNHTMAGGERIEIKTDELLVEVAESVGFSLRESWPMEVLRSRDIFRANASAAETILWLRPASRKVRSRT